MGLRSLHEERERDNCIVNCVTYVKVSLILTVYILEMYYLKFVSPLPLPPPHLHLQDVIFVFQRRSNVHFSVDFPDSDVMSRCSINIDNPQSRDAERELFFVAVFFFSFHLECVWKTRGKDGSHLYGVIYVTSSF